MSGQGEGSEFAEGNGSQGRVTRRGALSLAGAGAAGLGLGAGGAAFLGRRGGDDPSEASSADGGRLSLRGEHQPGIITPPQDHLTFAAFDLSSRDVGTLRDLMVKWTVVASDLMAGRRVGGSTPATPPEDPGESAGLAPARLSLTFGFGPSLFEALPSLERPGALEPIPGFDADDLDPRRSDGALCVQACADDPQTTFHAIHTLSRAGAGAVNLRWSQRGFRATLAGSDPPRQRNLFGFREGANNIALDDRDALDRHVWVGSRDEPAWMRGGTYMVVRRIRMLFDVWDATSLEGQERVFGRRKESGAPLGRRRETDRLPLKDTPSRPSPIPADAHVRLASSQANGGVRLLRRSYSFDDGARDGAGEPEAGLMFICFQRDPRRQFVPMQRKLAAEDGLGRHTVHTGSAVFACPPGIATTGSVAEHLVG